MTQDRDIQTAELIWEGITIEVSFEADWLGMASRHPEFGHAHLELRSLVPERAQLPMTETGYRSHFVARGMVEAAGGPVAFVQAWLDEAAKDPAWRKCQEAARQLSLF